jgi:hypothetical protein
LRIQYWYDAGELRELRISFAYLCHGLSHAEIELLFDRWQLLGTLKVEKGSLGLFDLRHHGELSGSGVLAMLGERIITGRRGK